MCSCFLQGEKLSPQVWTAVIVGLLGSCLVAYDGMMSSELGASAAQIVSDSPDELKGVFLLLASCLFYSLAIIRLGEFGEWGAELLHHRIRYELPTTSPVTTAGEEGT